MMKAKIHYYDIGDYLSREDKLKTIERFSSIENIPWTIIEPNEHGDWLNKRSELFQLYTPLEPTKKFDTTSKSVFIANGPAIASGRDSWVYNFSCNAIKRNMTRMIMFYNAQQEEYRKASANNKDLRVEDFVDANPTQISWTVNLIKSFAKGNVYRFTENIRHSLYRPFCKNNLYYDNAFIERPGLSRKLFPSTEHHNLVIYVSCMGTNNGLSLIIADCISDYHSIGDTQIFPLYWYDDSTSDIVDLFSTPEKKLDPYIRRDGVTDWILITARKQYGSKVTKEDIFYYVYGILHSSDYRTAFAADLKKSLPRLPLVESPDDFWAFSKAGRDLAELHLNYEKAEPFRGCVVSYAASTTKGDSINYRVEKMRFGKIDSKTADKTIIHYNNCITISDIPLEAYEYVINGKSAIEWIMERYQVKTDPASGILNDPNDWAKERNDEKYILNLLLSIINVSIKTIDIVKALPKLNFENN